MYLNVRLAVKLVGNNWETTKKRKIYSYFRISNELETVTWICSTTYVRLNKLLQNCQVSLKIEIIEIA